MLTGGIFGLYFGCVFALRANGMTDKSQARIEKAQSSGSIFDSKLGHTMAFGLPSAFTEVCLLAFLVSFRGRTSAVTATVLIDSDLTKLLVECQRQDARPAFVLFPMDLGIVYQRTSRTGILTSISVQSEFRNGNSLFLNK